MLGFLLKTLSLFAQNTVKLVLVDDSDGSPVGFATVSLLKDGQSKPSNYALSDSEGNVKLESVKNGSYTLKAELMGYITHTQKIKMENDRAVISFRAVPNTRMIMELCSFGSKIRILSPAVVRDAVIGEFRKALEKYEDYD